jgi:hypothetical protein
MNPQMPQKSHTSGGKKGKKKSGRMSTSDPQMPQTSHTSGGKKGKKKSGRMSTSDHQMPQKSHTSGGKKGKLQPGPTGPPGPSGQTRSVLGAAVAVGERAGADKTGKSSGQVQGERDNRKVEGSDRIWMNLTRILMLMYLCILLMIRNSALTSWYRQCRCSLLMLFNRSAKH